MTSSSFAGLSANAQASIAFERDNIREALSGEDFAQSTVASIRRDSLVRMLSLAASRLRQLTLRDGTASDVGTVHLMIESAGGHAYEVLLGTGRSGTGKDVPNLTLLSHSVDGDTHPTRLTEARFFDDGTDKPWCAASARTDREVAILAAMDALRTHLPEWDGVLSDHVMTRYSAEREMVVADGGFPGILCREHLETLRRDMVTGTLARIARLVPDLAARQKDAGYVWGTKFLAYDDTDKRSCALPVEEASACFHENIDLIDDNASWFVAVEPGPEGMPGKVSVWGFDRYEADPTALAGTAVSDGLSALPPRHVSLDLATGELHVLDGFDPTALVENAFHGVERDVEAFTDLAATFEGVGTEDRDDFEVFRPDRDLQEDGEDAPSP